MIKLSDEQKVIEKDSKNHKKGDVVDFSVYLERLDANNLVLKRGDTILNYFGDVQTALKRSLNYIVKGSEKELTLLRIEQQIKELHEAIDNLKGGKNNDMP